MLFRPNRPKIVRLDRRSVKKPGCIVVLPGSRIEHTRDALTLTLACASLCPSIGQTST